VLLEGSALVVAVLGVVFWISLGLDYWLEPGRGARQALLFLAIAVVGAAFVWYLALRLLRDFRSRSLALVLERRFPQLNDRLITAVEFAEREQALMKKRGQAPRSPLKKGTGTSRPGEFSGDSGVSLGASPLYEQAASSEPAPFFSSAHPVGLTAAMLERAADEAAELAQKLELGEVFNLRPLIRAMALAAVLLVLIGAFGLASSEVFSTWFRRSVLLADQFYRRDTDLSIYVLADPGERVMTFKDGLYRHPRGGDLTFVAEVPEGKKVPDRVQFTFRNVAGRGGGGDSMTKLGGRKFRHKLAGLHQSIDLWLRGGDFSTRRPLRVEVVEPPQIERMTLEARYPEYTGLNPPAEEGKEEVRQTVPVLGAQVSLPAGTDFVLSARFNKPIRDVRVQTEGFELALERGILRVAFSVAGSAAAEAPALNLVTAQPLLSADGRTIAVPFVLSVAPGPERISAEGQPLVPFRLDPDPVLRITMRDADDIVTSEPVRLAINSIADEPPQIETRLKGIGNSITRQATIPVVGEAHDPQDPVKVYGVTDDYGVADARFEFKLEGRTAADKEASFQPVPFSEKPEGQKQFGVDEKFKVLPLDLAIGQRLTLKVVASDADTLTGPHIASGTPFNFQVVTDDELLALVAVKELNIRRRFEQILEEVRNTRKDLLLHRTRLDEARPLRAESASAENQAERLEKLNSLDIAVATSVERSIGGIRKNANETQSIEEEFGDIRDELENNAVPDVKPMLERIDNGIIKPLHSINTVDYNSVDESLVLLRKVLEEKADPSARFDESVDQLGLTIEHLEAVLAQMLKLETVNEALQMLRDIIKSQEELQEKTRIERKKKLIEGLK
jgi:hypothetical protein